MTTDEQLDRVEEQLARNQVIIDRIIRNTKMLTRAEFERLELTVTQPTRTFTFTWPLVQPKPSWWRRLLRLIRR